MDEGPGGGFERFVSLRDKYPGLKLLVAVGGWGEGGKKYHQMATDPMKRKTFVTSLARELHCGIRDLCSVTTESCQDFVWLSSVASGFPDMM